MANKYEIIKNWMMNEASDDDLIQIVNEVNSYNGHLEEYCCYEVEMLNEFFCDTKPTDLLQKLASDFDINTDYIKFTIYGIESTTLEDMVSEIKNYAEDIAEEIENVLDDIYLPSELEEALEEAEE